MRSIDAGVESLVFAGGSVWAIASAVARGAIILVAFGCGMAQAQTGSSGGEAGRPDEALQASGAPGEAAGTPPPAAAAKPQAAPDPASQAPPDRDSDDPEQPPRPEAKEWRLKAPKVSGFVQVFYRYAFDTSGDGVVDSSNFRVQRVRISLKGEVLPWVSYKVEFDPRAPEVGGILRDAYFGLKFIPRHELRIGQQKTQFGYENPESSSQLYVVNRAEVSDSLSRGVNLRDIGVGLKGNVPLGGGFRLEDAITVVNGEGFNVQADNTRKKNVWGRLGVRYKSGGLLARFGVSGGRGDQREIGDPTNPQDDVLFAFDRLGTDFEIDHPRFFLNAEYVRGHDDLPALSSPEPTPAEVVDRKGYYVLVGGKTRWRVGPLVRYDTLDDGFRRWTIGAYYGLPAERFRALVNYEFRDSRDGARADDKLYFWAQVHF